MRQKLLSFFILLLLVSQSYAQLLSELPVIPKPRKVIDAQGEFVISPETKITYCEPESRSVATELSRLLSDALNANIEVKQYTAEEPNNINFRLVPDNKQLGSEGYLLSIDSSKITVAAATEAGLFYGFITLRQLFPWQVESNEHLARISVPSGLIIDWPEYQYRGMMLDVARHFFSVDEVKRLIDNLSLFKINYLHLHLTDDQGWRIVVDSWPKLTEIGGCTQVGGRRGKLYYTKEDFKQIVEYAADHHITIIPEIDMPGHVNAALASYPELNCRGRRHLYTGRRVLITSLCVDKQLVYRFIDDIVSELAELYPAAYFHIGGDESKATTHQQYVKFVDSVNLIVRRHGKKLVGWDEIAAANIDSCNVVQYWLNADNARLAVSKGAKLIFSPSKYCYLDMKYNKHTRPGLRWAGYIEVDKAYNWSPDTLIKGIGKDDILGIEAPLWTETVYKPSLIDYMVFPRICGHAEIGWTPSELRDWEDYSRRLGSFYKRFKALGINFYQSPKIKWQK